MLLFSLLIIRAVIIVSIRVVIIVIIGAIIILIIVVITSTVTFRMIFSVCLVVTEIHCMLKCGSTLSECGPRRVLAIMSLLYGCYESVGVLYLLYVFTLC